MREPPTRTVCCKLGVDGRDVPILAATRRAFNVAATWIARVCWDEGITNPTAAHHRVYGETRLANGLGAQLAICACMKAVEAVKAVKAKRREDRETCPHFVPHGSVRYDARSYTLTGQGRVSLSTLAGRVTCRLVLGERQLALLRDPAWAIGGADLVWRAGAYYLHISQSRDVPDPALIAATDTAGVLGVDLGIVNLASDSEGQQSTGQQVHEVRARYHLRRQRLQHCGTRNARRRIRRMGRREARFQRDVNHCISKHLVQKALAARKALGLEDLTGLRERTAVRRANRYERHSWAFFQLRMDLAYKAAWAGRPGRACPSTWWTRATPAAPARAAATAPRTIASCRRCSPARTRTSRAATWGTPITSRRVTWRHEQRHSGSPSTGLWRRPVRGRCKPSVLGVG